MITKMTVCLNCNNSVKTFLSSVYDFLFSLVCFALFVPILVSFVMYFNSKNIVVHDILSIF